MLNEREKEIIIRMAACDLNAKKASDEMYMCRNTLLYNIEKLRKKTGLDARKFYDLVKLLDLINEEEQP